MKHPPTTRRRFLQTAGAGVGAGSLLLSSRVRALTAGVRADQVAASLGDARLLIEFDPMMRSRLWHVGAAPDPQASPASQGTQVMRASRAPEGGGTDGGRILLSRWSASESLVLVDGSRVDRFALGEHSRSEVDGPLGRGVQLKMVGVSESQLEKSVQVELFERYPGMALLRVSYRNLSQKPIGIRRWRNGEMVLAAARAGQAAMADGSAARGVGSARATGDAACPPAGATAAGADGSDAAVDSSRGDASAVETRAKLISAASGGDKVDPPFWAFCGSTHSDRRDWIRRVQPGFSQDNFMGMSSSDYGGGTPIVDVWRRDVGVAIGHLELTPRLVSIPLTCNKSGAKLSITEVMGGEAPDSDTGAAEAVAADAGKKLQPGERFDTVETFVATHTGDHFSVLNAYRRIMEDRGFRSPAPPAVAYEPIWCAWGYERDCTVQLIEDTLPKVRELGLRWAVIDDGWQNNVGDWKLDPGKYPRGEADMRQLVQSIRTNDLEPRLWWAPLAAAPGSDVLHDHTDMLLRDKDGAPQNVTWWNSFYLCPGYDKTVSYTLDLVRKFIGEWGYGGLKIDGQHLNSVAPCFNPAHRHARPEESISRLQDFFQAIYQTAIGINPQAVVELCPCGTSYSFFNFRSFNQAPASDPESSWQVRHKGKTLKALMGPSAAFAGDHVELSDGGEDFASTVGIGAIVSTKFTWPRDPKPKDSFLLTPEREALWRKWITLYNERVLPLGTYRGELYDIGFDHPETHVIEKAGRFYYAFYAPEFTGTVPLRGLGVGRYRVRDYVNGHDLGEVTSKRNALRVTFQHALLIEAVPA
jgi:alpha-galactosidase